MLSSQRDICAASIRPTLALSWLIESCTPLSAMYRPDLDGAGRIVAEALERLGDELGNAASTRGAAGSWAARRLRLSGLLEAACWRRASPSPA